MLGGEAARWRLGSGTRSYERARARLGLVTCRLDRARLDGGLDCGVDCGVDQMSWEPWSGCCWLRVMGMVGLGRETRYPRGRLHTPSREPKW